MSRSRKERITFDRSRKGRDATTKGNPKKQVALPKKKFQLFPPFVKKPDFPPKKLKEIKVVFEDINLPVCGEEKFIPDMRGKYMVRCKDICILCEGFLRKKLVTLEHFEDVPLPEVDVDVDVDVDVEEEEEEEEVDLEKEEEIRRLKEDYFWTDMCEHPITHPDLDECEEIEGTTHRYVSHKIYVPYNQIPRPRSFQRRNKDIYYFVMSLPKKPSSPIRKNPKQFDLEGAYEEWRQKQSEKKEKTILDDSKRHVLDALKELIASKTLQEAAIVSMALQAVYDKISSTLTDAKIHTDVYTFINIALIWALSELELFDQDFERYFNTIVRLPEDFMLCSFTRKNILDITRDGGIRKVLLTVYRMPFSPNIHTTLHPRLPWAYIGPSHQQGHAKFYPNTIERIGEILEYKEAAFDSTYISDVICFHFMDVSEESYIAYRRKIYLFELSGIIDHKLTENLFLQLVHFI